MQRRRPPVPVDMPRSMQNLIHACWSQGRIHALFPTVALSCVHGMGVRRCYFPVSVYVCLDPAKRPSIDVVVARLHDAIIDCFIRDAKGRSLWKQFFKCQVWSCMCTVCVYIRICVITCWIRLYA